MRINSGCTVINGAGRPMAFFPAVFEGARPREIWAATSDDDMIQWQFHPANPIMTFESHGGPRYKKWDAPFIFHEGGRTFMILSSCHLEDRFVIPIYETSDPEMVRWEYRGLLHEIKLGSDTPYLECPMIFRDGQRWAIVGSPCPAGPTRYYTGNFDLGTLRFKPEKEGVLTYGAGPRGRLPDGGMDRGLAATSIHYDARGRCLMFGWQSGFATGRGWAGCLGLPRVLSIGPDGCPSQAPVQELQALRGEHVGMEAVVLDDCSQLVAGASGDTLEILAKFTSLSENRLRRGGQAHFAQKTPQNEPVPDGFRIGSMPGAAKAFGLKVRRSPDGSRAVVLRYDGRILDVAGTGVPFELGKNEDTLTLHVFLDKSVIEVFVNGGRHCVTRVIDSDSKDLGIELFAEGGSALVKSVDIWQMKPIWN
jgi:beta-fructofuranosidase